MRTCSTRTCKTWLCLALALLMLLSTLVVFTGCGEGDETDKPKETSGKTTESGDDAEADHRFDNVNYKNREFCIYTSVNAAATGMGNSNALIEGTGETDGGLVNDAVVARNASVEEALGVKLTYEHADFVYDKVAAEVRTLTASGLHEYDLIINDLYPFAELAIEGNFRNTLNEDCVFDFSRNYWYEDYMADLRLMNGYQYILAGDYFIDVIRSAHLLLLNKDIYRDQYKSDADELYDVVTNYEWTYEYMNNLISGVYFDKNGTEKKDDGDRFGFITPEYWAGSIAFTISGNPPFISRDEDGIPTVVIQEGERANNLANAMSAIFNNESSSVKLTAETDLLQAFADNECLIVDYQRLGSLENPQLRQMEGDACILPYPMLSASDKKYVTSTHDTTEVGAILATATDLAFTSTVIEVLNRETAKILMPKYYKEGLQVQYVDDSKAASMIDIIHDNFGNSFALAYNNALGNKILWSFSEAMEENREFSAVYASHVQSVNRDLRNKIRLFEAKKDNIN